MRCGVLAMLLLVGPAAAQGLKGPPPAADVAGMLPAELGAWRRGTVTEFESRPGGTGLGAAVEYRPSVGGAGGATIYLYDRGRTDLRDGIDPSVLEAELRGAVAEVEAVGPLRRYQVTDRPAPFDVAAEGRRPGLRCQPLLLVFEGGTRADSYACLGVVGGRFLKLRMTLPASAEELSVKAVTAFGGLVLATVQPPPVVEPRRVRAGAGR